MTGSTVNGSGNGARSGAQTLTLLSSRRTCLVLQALAEGTKRQVELRRAAGSPAQSTLRTHLRTLEQIGAIAKHRRNGFPGALEYELLGPGRELLFVISTLDRWLDGAPEEQPALSGDAAKAATKALSEGWSSTMLRVLAAGPRSLTELDSLIGAFNYPSLERRLGAMRLASLVEPAPSNGKGTPYAVTDWLRRGVAPIVAASRWERRHLAAETPPIGRLDAEAVLMLAVPLLQLPDNLSGSCRLVIELATGRAGRPAMITASVRGGGAALWEPRSSDGPDAWATGPASSWFRAAIEADPDHLEVGGDGRLALALLNGLHSALFGAQVLASS